MVSFAALSVGAAVAELVRPLHVDAAGASAGIETATAALAVVSAVLLIRRFRSSHLLRDLLLLVAVTALSLTDFAFAAAPALAGIDSAVSGTRARLALQALAAIVFAAAAFAPARKVARSARRTIALVGIALLATLAGAELLDLITGVTPLVGTVTRSQIAAPAHDPFALSVMICASSALIVAGVGFARGEPKDRTAAFLAGASFLLAAALLAPISMPDAHASWVTPADAVRLIALTALLAAACLLYSRARQEEAIQAVIAERRRIARDLHDGLAQDLATIALHAQRSHAGAEPDGVLMLAARRALAASRGQIGDLSASDAPTAEAALRRVADELAARFDVTVQVTVKAGTNTTRTSELDSFRREEIVRIAREAIVNAAAHGGAQFIEVTLDRHGSALRLRICDDGSGIAEGALAAGNGFGVPTMRARAAALGGRLIARSRLDGGTELEVVVR